MSSLVSLDIILTSKDNYFSEDIIKTLVSSGWNPLKNNKVTYDGTALTNGDGALFYGTNSSITINPTASLTSTGNNTVGVYVDGLYDNGNSDYEGINKGTIDFKDSSAGLYAVNGARLSNENKISAGDNSIGIYNENGTYKDPIGMVNELTYHIGVDENLSYEKKKEAIDAVRNSYRIAQLNKDKLQYYTKNISDEDIDALRYSTGLDITADNKYQKDPHHYQLD